MKERTQEEMERIRRGRRKYMRDYRRRKKEESKQRVEEFYMKYDAEHPDPDEPESSDE